MNQGTESVSIPIDRIASRRVEDFKPALLNILNAALAEVTAWRDDPDFEREVSELVMGPPVDFEGQDPEDMGDRTGLPEEGDFEVGGYLSTAACDRVDEVLHNHGIKL